MKAYSKAIAGFIGAFGPSLITALPDGVTVEELVRATILGLVAAVAVWAAPKNVEA
jgi:hypothetical protein